MANRIVSVHAGIYGMGIYAIMLPSSGFSVAHCCMHTTSDSTRRSRYTTRWFRTCANIMLYVHRARADLRGANFTLSVCLGHKNLS